MEQGSPEWYAARLGKVTASRVSDVIARTKTGWGAGRANYMAELLVERLTGVPTEGYVSPAMQWGKDAEPQARASYEWFVGADVSEIGFVEHPTIAMAGASPDGLCGDTGLVEIKAPNTATHIDTLLNQTIPGKYIAQMQWQMACTGREWCDFVSFDPRCPEHLRMWVKRVERDDKAIADLERDVSDFLSELAAKVEALNAMYAQKEAA